MFYFAIGQTNFFVILFACIALRFMSYRGTQGITYHVVERKTGRSLAAKSMHGAGDFMDYMKAEMDIMNQLCHPRLVRLWDAHEAKSSLTLAMDMYPFSRNIFIHIINRL